MEFGDCEKWQTFPKQHMHYIFHTPYVAKNVGVLVQDAKIILHRDSKQETHME